MFGEHGMVADGLVYILAKCWFVSMTFREVEMINKVILRFADESIIKGTTADFFPGKDIFHLSMMNDECPS